MKVLMYVEPFRMMISLSKKISTFRKWQHPLLPSYLYPQKDDENYLQWRYIFTEKHTQQKTSQPYTNNDEHHIHEAIEEKLMMMKIYRNMKNLQMKNIQKIYVFIYYLSISIKKIIFITQSLP